MSGRQITEGNYWVAVACPMCGRRVDVPVALDGVLKVKGGESTLSVALKQSAVPHDCDAEEPTPLFVDTTTGEMS